MNIHKLLFSLFLLHSTVSIAADEIHWTIMGQTSVTFDWRGTSAEDTISYGTSTGIYTNSTTAISPTPLPFSSPGPFWEAKITNLEENTLYYYSIANGPEATFKTPPLVGSSGFTIFVEADIGDTTSYSRVAPVQEMIANGKPAFVAVVGDLTYGNAHGQETVDQHFNDVMVWSRDAAYMPIWGNHEWDIESTDDLRNYKGRFDLPNSQTTPNSPAISCCGEDWYWFDYGNVRFITLPEPWPGAWVDWNTHATILMEEAQADPDITFIVTFVHRPAYSSGHHPGSKTLQGILDNLGEIFTKYVLNFNGHSHNYERTHPIHGVVHMTVGASGASLETDGSCLWLTCPQPTWSAFRAMRTGALKLDFSNSSIVGTYICGPAGGGTNDVDCNVGDVIDSFTIEITNTPPDTTQPSVPSNLTATAISDLQIDLSWSASTDNVYVSGYNISRDNIKIATTQATSFSNDGLSPSTPYTYAVSAFDAAGNISSNSTTATATTQQGDTLSFNPTDDATIKVDFPTNNYGSQKLETDSDPVEHFLMKFNVTGFNERTVSSAKLRLYCKNGSPKGGDFYHVSNNSWSESTVTWNNAPPAEQTIQASLGAVSNKKWYDVDLTSLIKTEGIYSLRISSTSRNGSDYSSKESSEFSPQLIIIFNNTTPSDITPPSIPADLNLTVISDSQINLSWSGSTDNVGVSGYIIFRDGINIGSTQTNFFADIGLTASTNYEYAVSAFDETGNSSEKSAIAVATTQSTPPKGSGDILTFIATDDATIKANRPFNNYGSKKLETDSNPVEHFLIKFSVSGINGQSVSNATLRLYNINGSKKGGDFYHITDNSWSESTVTWDNAPAAEPTLVASLGPTSIGNWYEVDLTSLVKSDGVYSLRVSSTSRDGADYNSKENLGFEPQLIVTVDPL